MTQLSEERRQFISDTAMYQRDLAARLVPNLVKQADTAKANRQTAVAIDYLDRGSRTRARQLQARLFKKVERNQSTHQRLRLVAIILCAVLPVAGGLWFHLTTPTESNSFDAPSQAIVQGPPGDELLVPISDALDAEASSPTAPIVDSSWCVRPLATAVRPSHPSQMQGQPILP